MSTVRLIKKPHFIYLLLGMQRNLPFQLQIIIQNSQGSVTHVIPMTPRQTGGQPNHKESVTSGQAPRMPSREFTPSVVSCQQAGLLRTAAITDAALSVKIMNAAPKLKTVEFVESNLTKTPAYYLLSFLTKGRRGTKHAYL